MYPTSYNGSNIPTSPQGYGPPPPQGFQPAAPYPPGPPINNQLPGPPSAPQGSNIPSYGPTPPQGYGPPSPHGFQPPAPYPPGPPINNQLPGPPGAPQGGSMNIPQGIPICPPGLEYLTMIDQLLVQQELEMTDVLGASARLNKFTVKNSLEQKVYFAAEESEYWMRSCLGGSRPFDMKIYDNYKNEIVYLHSPIACDNCCFPCGLRRLDVSSPTGTILATVQQEWSLFRPTFSIKNETGDKILTIDGPLCLFTIDRDVEYKIMSGDGAVQVGKICKLWSGVLRDGVAEDFSISFPMDLNVKMKAAILGACFLIDVVVFEQRRR